MNFVLVWPSICDLHISDLHILVCPRAPFLNLFVLYLCNYPDNLSSPIASNVIDINTTYGYGLNFILPKFILESIWF